jgi:hypothetical protein
MNELIDAISGFGVRETLVVLVVLVAVYMLVVLLRMKSLKSASALRKPDELASARYDADLAQAIRRKDDLDRFFISPAAAQPSPPRQAEARPVSKYFADELADSPKATGVASFDQEKLTRLERELSSTREELDALRASFAEVRDELRAEVERLKAAQRVSPMYADSLQLAIAGASAEDIAARCGIARAEAELVISLARGRAGEGGENGAKSPGGGRPRYGSY